MRPNLGLKFLLWSAIVALVVALVSGNAVFASLSAPLLALALLGLFLTPPRVASVRRSGLPKMIWTDDELEIELEMEVDGGPGLVSLYETLPEEFELSKGVNHLVFWVWGSGKRKAVYSITCRKRGNYQVRPTFWRSWHGLFLRSEKTGTCDNAMSTLAMPRPAAVPYGRVANDRTRLPSVGTTLTKVGIATTDFRELRPYSSGYPLKSINWKATARSISAGRGRPVTNQYESEGRRIVWLFTDASSENLVGDNLHNPLEQSLRLTMGAARYFLRRGAKVGSLIFGADAPIVHPDSGNRQLIRISRAVANLTPCESGGGLLGAVQQIGGSLVKDTPLCVVFTRLDLPEPEPLTAGVKRLAIVGLRSGRRTAPIVVGVNGYHWIQPADWYERNAVMLLHLGTRPLVRALHAAGAKVLEWQPATDSRCDGGEGTSAWF